MSETPTVSAAIAADELVEDLRKWERRWWHLLTPETSDAIAVAAMRLERMSRSWRGFL